MGRRPPATRAASGAVFDALRQQVADLRAEVADLKARLAQSSANSHRPPSADPPHAKPAPPEAPSGKRPGGQPGHARAVRPRLAPDAVVEHKPDRCGACRRPLAGDDPAPRRRQVWELPPVRPHVTGHRFHSLACPCGRVTPAPPADLPAGGYGPRLKAAPVYLTGAPHLSKAAAQALCADLLGLPVSTGQVGAAEAEAAVPAPAVEGLKQALPGRDVNRDETGWKQAGRTCWLWAAVTPLFTAFHLAFSRGRAVVEAPLGADYGGVLTADRRSAYGRVKRRQVCRAHLRRDSQALIDRGGEGAGVGERLLGLSDALFSWWHGLIDGHCDRPAFGRRLAGVKRRFRAAPGGGARGAGRAGGLCRELRRLGPQMGRCAEVAGVEPTNNAAGRALRPAVLWRKASQGTRTEAGPRCAAAVLSVAATCRRQGRRVWDYLTGAFDAAQHGQAAPPLLPKP